MKEIVVVSGKGGVGKSSITASICHLLSSRHKIVMADTDVDAPNLDIVAGATLKESADISASDKAYIDYEKCTACMKCMSVCRFASIIKSDMPVIMNYSCEGCGACEVVCPAKAIEIKKTVNGQIKIFQGKSGYIVSGDLRMGESSSGRLVDEVKNRARQKADAIGAEILFIDGPPGIGCPVISTLKGSDYVVAVTEPTPAALSDLKRVINVAGHFKPVISIIINKADINAGMTSLIKQYAEESGITILGEIPYDISIPRAVAMTLPVTSVYPFSPASVSIRELADRLENLSEIKQE
ncbi:MAG: ATP-binding protein [Dissulfurispiraceae bacterium]|jgi:MinD superfamily P-loop ATPase|nr:ATP-binding protein [Dissulfurispiraceae bacterium]